jgi:hypothetical protein
MARVNSQKTVFSMGASAVDDTPIAQITNFTIPNQTSTIIDASDLDSNDREFILGLRDNGEATFDINYDVGTGSHAALETAYDSKALKFFNILFTNGKQMSFNGYITGFEGTGSMDALITASVTIKVSGAITRSTATV